MLVLYMRGEESRTESEGIFYYCIDNKSTIIFYYISNY